MMRFDLSYLVLVVHVGLTLATTTLNCYICSPSYYRNIHQSNDKTRTTLFTAVQKFPQCELTHIRCKEGQDVCVHLHAVYYQMSNGAKYRIVKGCAKRKPDQHPNDCTRSAEERETTHLEQDAGKVVTKKVITDVTTCLCSRSFCNSASRSVISVLDPLFRSLCSKPSSVFCFVFIFSILLIHHVII